MDAIRRKACGISSPGARAKGLVAAPEAVRVLIRAPQTMAPRLRAADRRAARLGGGGGGGGAELMSRRRDYFSLIGFAPSPAIIIT